MGPHVPAYFGDMGKVIVKIKLTNLKDAFFKSAGARKAKPRAVEVEVLDFVVDSRGQNLAPNPAHGGEQMAEEYSER
jgi:hypothetical protein